MSKVVSAVLFLVLVAILAGCGGGGGASSVVPLDGTVRQAQPGDTWEYAITGTATDGTNTTAVAGIYSETVSASTVVTPQNVTARVILTSMSLTMGGRTSAIVGKEYCTQDPDGTVWTHGGQDNGQTYWITDPSTGRYKSMASPLSQGISWGTHVTENPGSSYDTSSVVIGTETVSVPAGSFQTFKTNISGMVGGVPTSGQEWYCPQLGNVVQRVITANYTDMGATLHLTMKLKAKNRASQPK